MKTEFFLVLKSSEFLYANDAQFFDKVVVPVVDEKDSKRSHLNGASRGIAPLGDARGKRVRFEFCKGFAKSRPFRRTAGVVKVKGLPVEDNLPARHSAPLGLEAFLGDSQIFHREFLPRIHPGHRLIDFAPDLRIVDAI